VWRSNWQGKWPCQIDREPWEHIHAGMCMHTEMAKTRRRRGWRLHFVFVSLAFLFCTTTCQVDRERSARVCAKRSNWCRKCRSIVCVWEVGVCGEGRRTNCFFLLWSFCGKERSAEAFCGERLQVLCWIFLKGEVRHERWRQLLKHGLLDEGEENGSAEGPEVLSFFQAKVATLSNWPREDKFEIGSWSAEGGGGGRVPRTCTSDRWANLSNWLETIAATYVTKNLSIWPRRNS
jgi:hypothetical protein